MPWLGVSNFRSIYVTDSATETKSEQIEHCLNQAKDEIAVLDGEAILAEIEAAETSDNRRKQLAYRRAQGRLAYRELLLIMSARFRSGGIIETERDANGDTTNKYVSVGDIERRRATLYADAVAAIKPYLTPEEKAIISTPTSGIVLIECEW